MPDGESTVEGSQPSGGGTKICAATSAVVEECSVAVSGVGFGAESSVGAQKTDKDPKKIARKYAILWFYSVGWFCFCCFWLVFVWLLRKVEENTSGYYYFLDNVLHFLHYLGPSRCFYYFLRWVCSSLLF